MESRDPRDPFDGLWMAALLMAAPLVAWWAWSDVWVTWAFQLKRVELKPVSYTHLDVYKRQPQEPFSMKKQLLTHQEMKPTKIIIKIISKAKQWKLN